MVITFLVLAGGTGVFWYLIYRQYRPAKRGRKEKKAEIKQPESSAEKQTESPKLKMEEFEHA